MPIYCDPENPKRRWQVKDANDLAEQMRLQDWRRPQAKDVAEFLVRSTESLRELGFTIRSDTAEHWLEDLIENGRLEKVSD
jgi:hypothetical protein